MDEKLLQIAVDVREIDHCSREFRPCVFRENLSLDVCHPQPLIPSISYRVQSALSFRESICHRFPRLMGRNVPHKPVYPYDSIPFSFPA